MKIAAVIAIFVALVGGVFLYQCSKTTANKIGYSHISHFGSSGVDGISMEPTLNSESKLQLSDITHSDITAGMILIAGYDDIVIVKRVERVAGIYYLIGDNRSHTTRHFLDRDKVMGFVRSYTTDGVTYEWDGQYYITR